MRSAKDTIFAVTTFALVVGVSFNYVYTKKSVKSLSDVTLSASYASAPTASVDMEKFIMDNPEVMIASMEQYQMKLIEERNKEIQKQVKNNMDKIYTENSFVIGNPDAEIKMVEFFDYNCGYCKQTAKVIKELAADNPNVKIYMKDTPILGKSSMEAAKAAIAAGLLGKYQEYSFELLAHNGSPLDETTYREIATKVGLDPNELIEMTNSQKVSDILMENRMAATIVELQGTPTIFIEGEQYVGPHTKADFEAKIRTLMEDKMAEAAEEISAE